LIDSEIRENLCEYLDNLHDKIRIIDELVIGKARADIITVTDILIGYEIKGDTDSYARLPAQIKEYDRFFQQNWLVVGASHRKSAAAHVPAHWGIICISGSESDFYVEILRDAADSPKFSFKIQLRLLWRNELAHILKANKLLKCSGKNKTYICRYLSETVPEDTLRSQICAELFERDWTRYPRKKLYRKPSLSFHYHQRQHGRG